MSEKAMAPHSSTLAWRVPWMEEPGGPQPMGSLRVGHDWATSLSLFPFMHWRRKWQPTPVFLPGESQGWGAWWAAVYGVAQSRTRLKRLSSSGSSVCMWPSLKGCGCKEGTCSGYRFPHLKPRLAESAQSVQWRPHRLPLTTTTICLINTVCVLLQRKQEEEREPSKWQHLLV